MKAKIIPLKNSRPDNGDFELSRVKCCPQCGQSFTTYQRIGSDHAPMQCDPMPRYGFGNRETCGDPVCWDLEDVMQFNLRVQWRRDHSQAKCGQVAYQERLI